MSIIFRRIQKCNSRFKNTLFSDHFYIATTEKKNCRNNFNILTGNKVILGSTSRSTMISLINFSLRRPSQLQRGTYKISFAEMDALCEQQSSNMTGNSTHKIFQGYIPYILTMPIYLYFYKHQPLFVIQ